MALASSSSTVPTRDKRIKVCVRLRPFTRTEKLKAGGKAAWTWHEKTIYQQIFPAQIPSRGASDDERKRSGGSVSSKSSVLRDSTAPSSYSFDYLYPPTTPTQKVYDETVKDTIMAAMEGYHSSVFLYGQTGTGKTYTMQGSRGDPGLIQHSVHDIFDHIARNVTMEFLLRFSYLEIYNERIYDLLAAGTKSDIKLYDVHTRSGNAREFVTKDVVMKGLREEIVLSPEHVLSLVEVGNLHRHVAATDSNDQSSRSHVIFRMVIESQAKRMEREPHDVAPVRSATLNIIDLAGSENVRLANTTGQALEEGKFINRSLLTLGHIIYKLSRDRSRKETSTNSAPHLPYRNSKLTRILQPSLGGQAQISIVCTASPSVECLVETHNTLRFASRARRVRNRMIVNEGLGESALLRQYRARIRELEEQLKLLMLRQRPQAQGNNATLDERQMELKFAINNINRVILNSSQAQDQRDEGIVQDATVSTQATARSQSEAQSVEQAPHSRPRLVHSGSSATTSSKTLIGSGGSASTKTLPLSTSSSRQLTDNDDDGTEMKKEDEPEHEETVDGRAPGLVTARPSLTSLLKSKYLDELLKMEERTGRWQDMDESELGKQKELLQEFVRGLEIAQAEHETRMSKIRELELENRRLRQAVAIQEEADTS